MLMSCIIPALTKGRSSHAYYVFTLKRDNCQCDCAEWLQLEDSNDVISPMKICKIAYVYLISRHCGVSEINIFPNSRGQQLRCFINQPNPYTVLQGIYIKIHFSCCLRKSHLFKWWTVSTQDLS